MLQEGMDMVGGPATVEGLAPAVRNKPRLAFVDNLRWVMIVLVVSMHAAVTYSHLGSWYFMEDPKPSTWGVALFATYQVFLQAFFMGLLFLVAGYFVPGAFDRKGWRGFLRDRSMRLGVPSLFYMLVIQPVTVYWLLRDFADPGRPSLREAYLPYVSRGRFLGGSGPMWFAVALLGFSVVYCLVRGFGKAPPVQKPVDGPLPGHRHVFGLGLFIGLCAFLVRIVQPIGTSVLNMQLCFFSQYVVLFIVGVYAWRRNWLLRVPYNFGLRWFFWTLVVGTVFWLALLFALLTTHSEARLSGGLTWQSAAFSFWESLFCVGISLGLIVLFREKFNYQGPVARWLSDNSFSVYMFHPPVLIAITLVLRGLDAPKPVKFLCATLLGVGLTYLASSLVFRRVPLLRRVL